MRDIEDILAERMRTLRKARGMNQDDLAAASGKSRSAIAQIETNIIWPQPETLRAIAAALDVPVSDLFDDGRKPREAAPIRELLLALAALDDGQIRRHLDAIADDAAVTAAASRGESLPKPPQERAHPRKPARRAR